MQLNFTKLEEHHPKITEAKGLARQWLQEFKAGRPHFFVLVGPNGIGKTELARQMLWYTGYYADEDGSPIQPLGEFMTAEWLMTMMNNGISLEDIIERGKVAVIDDVSKETSHRFVPGEAQQSQTYTFYNTLVEFCIEKPLIGSERCHTPLIFTGSNVAGTLADFAYYIGPSAFDRVQDMAGKFIVDFTNVPSWRKKRNGRENWDATREVGR